MNVLRTISRVLGVVAVAFVANVGATCPLFLHKGVTSLENNKMKIASSILADKMCNKDEHLKKAFIVATGSSVLNSDYKPEKFAERLVVAYTIRKGSELLNVNGLRDAALKTCDVIPEGMIRDTVNPVVKGAAEVATHPEFITYLLVELGLPAFVAMMKGRNGSVL